MLFPLLLKNLVTEITDFEQKMFVSIFIFHLLLPIVSCPLPPKGGSLIAPLQGGWGVIPVQLFQFYN
jgi:hypothetical protein